MIYHMIWKKYKKSSIGPGTYIRYEGWFLLGFIPLYIRCLSETQK